MNYAKIDQEFHKAKTTPSDINEHLDVLLAYAQKSESVTEMGVRSVVATWAFLKGCKKYIGYDMFVHPNMKQIPEVHDNARVIIQDVLDANIEETDMIFFDTFHTATQLKRELERHADKAKKYLGFHDTFTFWVTGEQPYPGMGGKGVDCGRGLKFAIEPFLKNNPQWTIAYKTDRNNGLTILQRS